MKISPVIYIAIGAIFGFIVATAIWTYRAVRSPENELRALILEAGVVNGMSFQTEQEKAKLNFHLQKMGMVKRVNRGAQYEYYVGKEFKINNGFRLSPVALHFKDSGICNFYLFPDVRHQGL